MSKQSEDCRTKAAECERRAAMAAYPEAQEWYSGLARLWSNMAREAEALENVHRRDRPSALHAAANAIAKMSEVD
jgi:hypothetical protein